MKRQELLSKTRKAVDDFSMIEEGDKIAIGLSGGKDSLALLIALSDMRVFYPKPYDLVAIMVSLGFEGEDYSQVKAFCETFDVAFHVVQTNIGDIVFKERQEKNPCSLCSKMRKGALNEKAKALGCNKVALGHHMDDLIESFFMSLFYEGRLHTFSPYLHWDKIDIYGIRPLIYCKESEIINFMNREELPVMKNPCVADGITKRTEIKELVAREAKNIPYLREKVFGAIRRSGIKGWYHNN